MAVAVLLGLVPGVLSAVLWESSALATTASIFFSHWFLVAFFTVAYRLSPFHPLARYPGPLLCKISKGWLAYVAGKHAKAHVYVKELHDRYGDVVRIGALDLRYAHKEC